MTKVAVIGGGAAGLAAAVSAGQAGAEVSILEAEKRVGKKILKTGNGRCNLTNAVVRPEDYYEAFSVTDLIAQYPSSRILEFFHGLGLLTMKEGEGRIYPLSNSANTVLDVLREGCKVNGVRERCMHKVTDIQATGSCYEITCANNNKVLADCVIVATGGGTRLLEALGHTIKPFKPVLCPLETDTAPLKGLSGIRVRANVSAFESEESSIPLASQYGEVLFRDYGVSGIAVFDMSRVVQEGYCLGLDFLPQFSPAQCENYFQAKFASMSAKYGQRFGEVPTFSEFMCGCFHTRVNDAIVRMAGFKPSAYMQREDASRIAHAAKNFRMRVLGPTETASAQVTRGGASIWEFDSITMESKLRPRLFAAGETLDVDGRCGGFNLHWAWATGMAAGAAAAAKQ